MPAVQLILINMMSLQQPSKASLLHTSANNSTSSISLREAVNHHILGPDRCPVSVERWCAFLLLMSTTAAVTAEASATMHPSAIPMMTPTLSFWRPMVVLVLEPWYVEWGYAQLAFRAFAVKSTTVSLGAAARYIRNSNQLWSIQTLYQKDAASFNSTWNARSTPQLSCTHRC